MATSLVKWMIAALIFSFAQNNGVYSSNNHPFYVSVTEINHNAKDKTLEISCKIFTNDFETTLEKAFKTKVDLRSIKDKNENDKKINDYIISHLKINVDGKPVQVQFVGSEIKEEGTWSYFQINNIPAVKRIDIRNSILYESFESEINIMHV